MYRIVITLRSALCAASGDGFASVIDTDITTDSNGIPYIPARRLKGCLREAADYIGAAQIDGIFGEPRAMRPGALRLSNAYLREHDAVTMAGRARGLQPTQITSLFTETIASTALGEDGSAKDNTLRFLRAVAAKTPWDPEAPLVFVADVRLDDRYAAEMARICRALRHIGYKRRRGFGAVSCRLEQYDAPAPPQMPDIPDVAAPYTLTYAVHLDGPLMLPGDSLDETRDYVSGAQVIGALAGAYLKESPADAAFEALFLSEDVRFSDLRLTDETLRESIPVPQYLGRSKDPQDVGRVLNMLEPSDKIIKPIKSGLICKDMDILNARTERIYHDAVHGKDGTKLYTQHCLQAGQYLRGTITAPGQKLRQIAALLRCTPLTFGRSRTAQYAGCSLTAVSVAPERVGTVRIEAGQYAVYALASDVILMDAYGGYTTDVEALCAALGLDAAAIDTAHSALRYTTIAGFLTVMGLQKAHIRAIGAGSILVVKADAPLTLPDTLYIGMQQTAGFGVVKVFPSDQLLVNAEDSLRAPVLPHTENDEVTAFFERIADDDAMRSKAIAYAVERSVEVKRDTKIWTPSFIGRLTRMVKQSASKDDLDARIEGIRTEAKRKAAQALIKDAAPPPHSGWERHQRYLLTILTVLKYREKTKEASA